jgi:hypothetical protein
LGLAGISDWLMFWARVTKSAGMRMMVVLFSAPISEISGVVYDAWGLFLGLPSRREPLIVSKRTGHAGKREI